MNFKTFTDLISSVFVNETVFVSSHVLRLTFDALFDQNSNGTIEPEEFESLYILLQGYNEHDRVLFNENFRRIIGNRNHCVSFKGITIMKNKTNIE